jgi:hypothetical protein
MQEGTKSKIFDRKNLKNNWSYISIVLSFPQSVQFFLDSPRTGSQVVAGEEKSNPNWAGTRDPSPTYVPPVPSASRPHLWYTSVHHCGNPDLTYHIQQLHSHKPSNWVIPDPEPSSGYLTSIRQFL